MTVFVVKNSGKLFGPFSTAQAAVDWAMDVYGRFSAVASWNIVPLNPPTSEYAKNTRDYSRGGES